MIEGIVVAFGLALCVLVWLELSRLMRISLLVICVVVLRREKGERGRIKERGSSRYL